MSKTAEQIRKKGLIVQPLSPLMNQQFSSRLLEWTEADRHWFVRSAWSRVRERCLQWWQQARQEMSLHSMDPAWTKNPLVLLWVAWLLCLPQLFFFLIIRWLIYLAFFPFCILSYLYLLLKVREFEDHTSQSTHVLVFFICVPIFVGIVSDLICFAF